MISLIIGRRTRGKSTLGYVVALQKPMRVIFDPRRQFHTTDDIIPAPFNLYEMMGERSEIIIQPMDKIEGSFELTCSEIFDFVEENPGEQIAFLVDEVRFLDTPNIEYPSFDKLIRFTNPKQIDIILTCHRPVDISTDIRAIADFWCIFQTTQEHDLQIIRQRCGESCAEAVRNLKDKEFLLWDDGEGKFSIRTNPTAWFIPIDRKATVTQ